MRFPPFVKRAVSFDLNTFLLCFINAFIGLYTMEGKGGQGDRVCPFLLDAVGTGSQLLFLNFDVWLQNDAFVRLRYPNSSLLLLTVTHIPILCLYLHHIMKYNPFGLIRRAHSKTQNRKLN